MPFAPGVIDDPLASRLEPYREVRERDLVGRRGLFIAEGLVVLRALLRSEAFEPVSILVSEAKLPGVSALLGETPTRAPVLVASQAVMDATVGFAIHRGVLALGRRREAAPGAAALLSRPPQSALVLAAFGIGNHDNIGALFRNAAAFGVDAVLIDDRCCDPLYRKSLRVSVGAGLLVPWASAGSENDLLDVLTGKGFDLLALSPYGESRLVDVVSSKRVALLVGAEGGGLSKAVMDRCRTVRIPMAPGFDSLNVATAAAIALSRLREGRSAG